MNQFISVDDLHISVSNFALESSEPPQANPFTPIGIGKPIVVRFHSLHVGDLKNGLLNKKQGILLTSVIKDDITYDIGTRGVHQVYKGVTDNTTLYPMSINEGTELIYYIPSLDTGKLNFTIEAKADRFNQNTADDIGNAMHSAAGLPVFAPIQSFLLTGGQLVKIAGSALNKLLEKVPLLSYPFSISTDLAGIPDTTAGFKIGGNPQDLQVLKGYKVAPDPLIQGAVRLEKGGVPYEGNIPYVIISVDGKKVDRYRGFKATAASASLMKKFYGISETTKVDDVTKMLELYNDYTYIQKSKKLSKQIKDTSDESAKASMKELLEAYKKNIENEEFLSILNK